MMPSCWELNGLDMGESVSLACFSLVQGSDFILLLGRGERFSMIKHPKLMDICRERKIALEVCPISLVISSTSSCGDPK